MSDENTDATQPVLGMRVLVVEDNPINQKVAIGLISRLGHTVSVANNGQEAVERVRAETFDLIFMDIHMPIMDGMEATQAIRALGGEIAATPIVAMTAKALSGDREKCLQAGLDDYLPKPVSRDLLAACLEKFRHGRVEETPNAPTPAPSAPLIDDAIADELRATVGEDVYGELARALLATLSEQLSDVRQAFDNNDREAVAFMAKSMSGAAANIGFAALSQHADALTTMATARTNEPLHEHLDNLSAMLDLYSKKF